MTVKRIISNIAAKNIADVQRFYTELLGLSLVMDHGWIATLASGETAQTQLSIASQGGSGTAVPDLSIEVDDVDAVHARAETLGVEITYPLTDEPWGVRRFYLIDPAGKLINILAHSGE